MKPTLLLFACILYQTILAQKTLVSTTRYEVGDPINMVPDYYDSTSNIYGNGNGVLTSHKLVFAYNPNIFNYQFRGLGNYEFSEQKYYSGNAYPLTQNASTFNTFSGNELIQTDYLNIRRLYSYDASGNLITEIGETFTNGAWSLSDSISLTYTNSGELLTQTTFSLNFGGSLEFFTSDSAFYDPISGKIHQVRGSHLDPVTGNVFPNYRREFNYDGTGQLEFADVYEFNYPQEVLVWDQRVYYLFQATLPSEIKMFNVLGGTIQSDPTIELYYEYDVYENLTKQTFIENDDTLLVENFYYLDSNFIDRIEALTPPNSTVLGNYITHFYYNDILDLSQNNDINITLFPNPTSDILEIQTDKIIENIKIYNFNGQLVMEQTSGILDVRDLRSGKYIIRGVTSAGSFSQEFIKI